jgi:hypothetical protein
MLVYTITAIGPGGTVTQDITINIPPAPVINSFTVSPSPIPIGSNSTLIWAISNSITSLTIDQGIGSVIGQDPILTVSPTTTTTYTITATGPGGTSTATATVSVIPTPTITFSASPANLTTGSSSTLTWDAPSADTITIDQGIGSVSNSGSITVTPSNTTTYTITATNISGTTTDTVTIGVYPLPTINSFTVNPSTIVAGNSSTLSWNVTGAQTVFISGGVGAVSSSGSRTVSSSSSITYTLTASNAAGGSRTANTTLIVNYPPSVTSFYASPSTINSGSSSRLYWTTSNANNVTIVNQSTGQTILNNGATTGSISISPASLTTYRITANGSGGTANATTSVNVTCSESTINAQYGSNVCGSCGAERCFGTYWRCTDGQYYGNVFQMGGIVRDTNGLHFNACGRYIRSSEIVSEVGIYQSLGFVPSAYSANVASRKGRTTQPLTTCGNSVTSLSSSRYCSG